MNKKVLFVTHHMTIGGVQKSLITALNHLDYSKLDVTLYLRKNRCDLLPYVNEHVKVIVNDDTHHYYRKPYAIWLQLQEILLKLLKKNTEKVHTRLSEYLRKCEMQYEHRHFFQNEAYDVAVAYVQGPTTLFVDQYVTAKKKIVCYQGSTDECHEIHEITLPHFDVIVVEHENIKAEMIKWYCGIDKKFAIVENYADRELMLRQSKEKVIARKNKIVISSCGRLAHVKGFDLAVEAAKILKQKNYDFHWYLVGDGPEMENLKQSVSEYGLEQYVEFTGMQKNPYPYIAASDIFVQPSYEEALSIAALESQLLCIPIVSTKTVGGCSMITDGENGVLTDINADSLAEGIIRLMEDSSLRRHIQKTLLNMVNSAEEERYRKDWAELLEGEDEIQCNYSSL